MRRRSIKHSVLFGGILKWVALASLIGAMVGAATAGFLKLLTVATEWAGSYGYSLYLLPIGFFLDSLLIRYLTPDGVGFGMDRVIAAIHQRSGRIGTLAVPANLTAIIITPALGGSAGKEGSCAHRRPVVSFRRCSAH